MRIVTLDLSAAVGMEIFRITGLADPEEYLGGRLFYHKSESAYEQDELFMPGVKLDNIREFLISPYSWDRRNPLYAIENVSRIAAYFDCNGEKKIINEPLDLYLEDGIFCLQDFLRRHEIFCEINEDEVADSIDWYGGMQDRICMTEQALHFYRAEHDYESGDMYFADGTLVIDGENVNELHWKSQYNQVLKGAPVPENNMLMHGLHRYTVCEFTKMIQPREGGCVQQIIFTTDQTTYCYIPGKGKFDLERDYCVLERPVLGIEGLVAKEYYKYITSITKSGYFLKKVSDDYDDEVCDTEIVFAPGAIEYKGKEVTHVGCRVRADWEHNLDLSYERVDEILESNHKFVRPMELVTVNTVLNQLYEGEFQLNIYTAECTFSYSFNNCEDDYGEVLFPEFRARTDSGEIYVKSTLDAENSAKEVSKLFAVFLSCKELTEIERTFKVAPLLGIVSIAGFVSIRKDSSGDIHCYGNGKKIVLPSAEVPADVDLAEFKIDFDSIS